MLIQQKASLSLANAQLKLVNDDGTHTVPVEDIACIVLDSPQVMLTSALLAFTQQHGVAVVTCDKFHHPNGILLPFHGHSRQTEVAFLQQQVSEAFNKRLWQRIIKQKITNQAVCLQLVNPAAINTLQAMARRVKSGDPDNIEAQAARYYWAKLFPDDATNRVKRGAEDLRNAALNYGYAIVRACVARALVAYGLLPCFGIHHRSTLNAYNLADDLLEVLRPFVDREVLTLVATISPEQEDDSGLTKKHRQQLVQLAHASI